jgi:hypothetical protein
MKTEHLIERFADAQLTLELAKAPFARAMNADDIFQMDIRRRKQRSAHSEYFLVWPGHADNIVVVQGVDARERQLVLMVREPEREFYVPTRNGGFLRRTTPGSKRHFLAGRDERQLFMCRLPRACTTVRQAHEALRAPQVKESRSAIDRTLRQGEWFFLVPSETEREELESAIAGHRSWIRNKVSIGSIIFRAGKPHVADELVVHRNATGENRVYVRGAVRHADHKTLRFDHWREVVRNREVDAIPAPLGGTWID